ncbi:MAG: hypothetical protein PHC64_03740 [Candidatus Gastranaerophilales bacterium]|nr:hypothetical protein [Candidatus Gastranaerophilales bacterium]
MRITPINNTNLQKRDYNSNFKKNTNPNSNISFEKIYLSDKFLDVLNNASKNHYLDDSKFYDLVDLMRQLSICKKKGVGHLELGYVDQYVQTNSTAVLVAPNGDVTSTFINRGPLNEVIAKALRFFLGDKNPPITPCQAGEVWGVFEAMTTMLRYHGQFDK